MAGRQPPRLRMVLEDAFKPATDRSGRGNVQSLFALGSLDDLECHLLALFKGLEPVHLDRREVREQVFTAVVGSDETESLGVVEPLHGTRGFWVVPLDSGCGRIRHADCLLNHMLTEGLPGRAVSPPFPRLTNS